MGAQFGFKLVNLEDDNGSKRTGKEDEFCIDCNSEAMPTGTVHKFSFNDDYCEAKLLPCAEIVSRNDAFLRVLPIKRLLPDERFVRDDHFRVRLDMRVKQKDNELCKVTVDGKTATCLVCFPPCFDAIVLLWSWNLVGVEIPETYESMARCHRNHQNRRLSTVSVSQVSWRPFEVSL